MSKPWFDSETGILLFDEYVAEMPSFQKILEDGIITETELIEQSERVIAILKKLELMLSDEEKEVAAEAFCELAVLYAVGRKAMEYRA